MCNMRDLIIAIIIQTCKDLRSDIPRIQKQAVADVKKGRIRIYLDFLDIELSDDEFINFVCNLGNVKNSMFDKKTQSFCRKVLRGAKF